MCAGEPVVWSSPLARTCTKCWRACCLEWTKHCPRKGHNLRATTLLETCSDAARNASLAALRQAIHAPETCPLELKSSLGLLHGLPSRSSSSHKPRLLPFALTVTPAACGDQLFATADARRRAPGETGVVSIARPFCPCTVIELIQHYLSSTTVRCLVTREGGANRGGASSAAGDATDRCGGSWFSWSHSPLSSIPDARTTVPWHA
jgi:hypothetical protein